MAANMAMNMAKSIPHESDPFTGRSTTLKGEKSGDTQPDDAKSGSKKSNVKFELGRDKLKANSDGNEKKLKQKGKDKSDSHKYNYVEKNDDDDEGDNDGKKEKGDGKNKKQNGREDDDEDGKKQKYAEGKDDDEEEEEVDEKDGQRGRNDWKRTFNDAGHFESRIMKNENLNQRWGECFLDRGGPNCLVDLTDALESDDYFVYVGPEKLDFNKSRSLCLGRNMYLAEVSTPFEAELLKKVMKRKDTDTYWLGMSRDFGDRQLFYWDDGQPTNNFVNLALNANNIVTNEALFCFVKHVSNREHLHLDCLNQPPDSYPICMYKPGHVIPPALRNIVYTL